MNMNTRSYSEMLQFDNYIDRFNYLKLGGKVGRETFGFDRYLNQTLYRSEEWKRFRRDVILRDNGLDLGMNGYEIHDKILIHHINPLTPDDVINRSHKIFDMNNVISCSLNTHNAIHYGDASLLIADPIERTPYDTCPWKKI